MKPLLPLALSALFGVAACSEPSVPEPKAQPDPVAETDMPAAPALGTPIADIAPAASPKAGDDSVAEMEWDALIPDDFRPDRIMARYDLDNITDDDPRAEQLQSELQALWDQAPVREELDGRRIKLPGFVVPVETDAEESTGFLLVPYYGACIHVPPPPANQTVYVVTQKGEGTKPKLFDIVWVTGELSVKRIDNDVAEAGYTLYASDVAPYE